MLKTAPVLWVVTIRLIAAVLVLSLFALILPSQRRIWRIFRPQRSWRFVLPGAFFGSYIVMLCWVSGFKYTDASTSGVPNQLSTVIIVVLAAVFLKESLSTRKVISVALAVLGAILVVA